MSDVQQPEEPATGPIAPVPSPVPPRAPPKFDLGMVAALSCLPVTVLGLFAPNMDWWARVAILVFVTGIGIHCALRWRAGRELGYAALTGLWLLPTIAVVVACVEAGFVGRIRPEELFCPGFGLALAGLVAGYVTTKQIEGLIVLGSMLRHRLRGRAPRRESFDSFNERLDEVSTPLDMPPLFGLPRRFSIRGLLIVTTWAAVLLGSLRASGANPSVYFMVMTFLAGTLASQVLLFRGRRPIEASMWAGACVLPAETLALVVYWRSQDVFGRTNEFILSCALSCACLVPAGIILGALAGAIGGVLYLGSDDFLIWIFRGVPKIELVSITDADADVLVHWICGPKFCRRWAGGQLTWPLDRQQLVGRFAAATRDPQADHCRAVVPAPVPGDQPARRILKAVDVRSGEMLGYLELHTFGPSPRRAMIQLPLIDPAASERGRLAVQMLRSAATHAFSRMGLISVWVATVADQPELAQCCEKAWLGFEYHKLRDEIHVVARFYNPGAIP